jgi:hypothetical protein
MPTETPVRKILGNKIIGDRPRLILRAVGHGKGRKQKRDDASRITQEFNRDLPPVIGLLLIRTILISGKANVKNNNKNLMQ